MSKRDDVKILYSPVCTFCARWHPDQDPAVCDAFPDGIPVSIWVGDDKHQTIHPGDRGKVFVLREGFVKPDWMKE